MRLAVTISISLLIPFIAAGQDRVIPVREAHLEAWRDVNFTQAANMDEVFGRLHTVRPPRSRSLLGSGKLSRKDVFRNDAALFAAPSDEERAAAATNQRSATQLPAPPHQLEGFVAIPDNNMGIPPDCAGAVSPNHIVTVLNTEFRVQDRQGKDLRTLSVERFFSAAGPFSTGLYDPRIAWDQTNKRWIAIILADAGGRTPAMLIAVSNGEDPLGDWRISRLLNPSAVGLSFDFPRMSLSGPFLMVSVNVYRGDDYESTQNSIFYLSDIYAQRSVVRQFEDFLSTNTPVEDPNRQSTKAYFANTAIGIFDLTLRFVIREVQAVPNAVNVLDRVVANAGETDPRYLSSILPQQGSPVLIDGGDTDLANCTARGTDVWCAGTVFLLFGTQRTSVIQIYQFSTAALPAVPNVGRIRIDDPNFTNFYAYPSIAVNKNKDVFVGYNRFRNDRHPSAHFAFRRATDPTAGYYHDALLKAGEDVYTKGGFRVRWGDYSSTVVDPVDDTSFWTLQEYSVTRTDAGLSQWGTWWTKFSQRSTPCTYRLDRANADVPFSANSLRVTLTANLNDCTRIVAPNASWITTSALSSPTGSATLDFQIALNRTNTARTGTITVGDQTFTVNQAANPVPAVQEPFLNITRVEAPTTARIGDSVTVSASVKNSGTRGAATFRIAFYLSTKTPVTNKDTFSGFGCVVQQGLLTDESFTCNGSFQIGNDLAPGTYYLAAIADDREQVTMSDRSGTVRNSEAGILTVRAAANAPAISSGGIVNGASARAGSVAPGLIFVLYGARLGPTALTTLTLDANGRVTTTLAGTQILFDGSPAPLIYTSSGQVSGIVPYNVAGKSTVRVEAVLNGLRGDAVTVPVAPTAPALFSVDFSGQNQVAALNEDGSVNSAANPVEAGKLIVLYGTGGGTFRTQPVDGAVVGVPLPEFLNALSLEIDGKPAELLYAGPAPGLVSGVFQINARVPQGVAGEKVNVLVRSGATASLAGTTIAVK